MPSKKVKKAQNKARIDKMIKKTDQRIAEDKGRVIRKKKEDPQELKIVEAPQSSSALFLNYNTQLGPPFHILIDTNFVNFAIKNKIDVYNGFYRCLCAKTIPYITDCVLAELETYSRKFSIALKIIKDPRFQRLKCNHKGKYADDCLVQRVKQHKCYIVATCDKDLRRRLRKVPGVPIMYIRAHRFYIERMPDAYGAPKF